MKITYTRVGDYYLPNLVAPESPKVGRWGMLRFNYLRQHRTIASASLSRLFAPLPQFRKWEIHTVFLHFRNFELEQKSCLRLLAELCGAALNISHFPIDRLQPV